MAQNDKQLDELDAKLIELYPELKNKLAEFKINIANSIRNYAKNNSKKINKHMNEDGFDQNKKNRLLRNILGHGVASHTINNNKSIPICIYCDKPNKKAQICSGCDIVYYCDNNCQIKDWKNHKILCDNGLQYKKLLELRAAIRNGDTSVEEEEAIIINEIVLNRMNSQKGLHKLSSVLQIREIIMEIIFDMKELEGIITKSMKKLLIKKYRSVLYKKCVQCSKCNNLLYCGKCKNVYYCSKKCQKTNWKQHKIICHFRVGQFF